MAARALVWVAIGFVIDQLGVCVRPDLEAAEVATSLAAARHRQTAGFVIGELAGEEGFEPSIP